MKLVLSTAPNISVYFLPSRYAKTRPQIIPKGKPFINRKRIFAGPGTSAKKSKAISAKSTRAIMLAARFCPGISETTLIPINLETV